MDFREFVAKWSPSSSAERANKDAFLIDFCDALGVDRPRPTTGRADADDFVFEHDALISHENGRVSVGKIDLYKKGCFLLEAKQGSEAGATKLGTAKRNTAGWNIAMRDAFGQALGYARTLDDPPPFVIVCDIGHCFDLYASFDGSGNYRPFPDALHSRTYLTNFSDADAETFRTVFTDPLSLDPSKRSAKVTREIAAHIANLARALEGGGYEPENVAKFLMRCLFTMFAEDVDLLPKRTFSDMLQRWIDDPSLFVPELEAFWKTMNTGGSLPYVGRVWRFNGGLFADVSVLPLKRGQILLLGLAAESNWAEVEPAIFGTLLERALDPKERHRLGAHYTPRAYVERLVKPAIEEPLRAEWDLVQAEVRQIISGAKDDRKAMIDARKPVYAFYDRLCDLRVLDPACGSGNFLFVALDLFKRLENEILDLLHDLGDEAIFNQHGRPVTPEQFLGIEIKPWAKEITELVLWIGYLQWQIRTRGWTTRVPEPVLRDYQNIECRDAVLAYDRVEVLLDDDGKPVTRWDGETMKRHPATGEDVPDERKQIDVERYVNPRKAEWPRADFVVGNPPFIGNKKMRTVLGDGYVDALRSAHSDVPDSADFVMYWWNQAAHLSRTGAIRRFGLITTNSITQPAARKLLQRHLHGEPPLSLRFAIPDHPWSDSETGAAVRIAMTVADCETGSGLLSRVVSEQDIGSDERAITLESRAGVMNASLQVGGDVTAAVSLKSNADLSFMGVTLVGDFRLPLTEAANFSSSPVVKPYLIGRELTQQNEKGYVIDLFGLSEEEAQRQHAALYQRLFDRVKPARDQNKRDSYRKNWWVFGEARPAMRKATSGLERYIATPETSKHRVFAFLSKQVIADHTIFIVASRDPFDLGILSSRIHSVWSSAAGSRMGVGNDLRYRNVTCFDPFPFPTATAEQQQRIRDLGEELDAHRKRQQALYPDLTITGMYNVLEKLRAGEALNEKETAIHQNGLVSILRQLHDQLDDAVFEAYGWPATLTDDEILERVVALNRERAEEEKRGLVRWLRPEFQNPRQRVEEQQTEMAGLAKPDVPASGKESRLEWPSRLPERIAAVRSEFFISPATFQTDDVMRRFRNARRRDIDEVLESLEALGLLVSYVEGAEKRWKPLRSPFGQPRASRRS